MKAKRTKVLVVEDSSDQAELLRYQLKDAGYTVIVANDGAEGLALASRHQPDVVVTDVKMPVMDGYALCRAIRQDDRLKRMPVIMLTVLSDPMDVVEAVNAGADAYVSKPYDVPALVDRIESLKAFPIPPPPRQERRKVALHLEGKTFMVDAHGPRILNLLVSAYKSASVQNRDLVATRRALEELNQHLEQLVADKTAALRESESQLTNALKVGRMAHWQYDIASDTFTFNDNFYEMYRSSADEVGGYTMSAAEYVRRFVHPDDIEVVTEVIHAMFKSPEHEVSKDVEHRIVYGDGEAGYVAVRFVMYRDDKGRTVRTFGVNQDITARKRQEREAEFRSTVIATQQETSPDAILLVDENARILSYNKKFVDLWSIPKELVREADDEPVLRSVVRQVEDPEAFLAKIRGIYDDRQAHVHDQLTLRDGRVVERHSAPVVGAQGMYYGRVWYFRDVTGRVRAEQTIRDSEAKFRGAVDQSPVGIVMMQGGAFIYVNPTGLSMFGYTSDEFMRTTPADLVVDSERSRLLKDMQALETGKVAALHDVYPAVRKDGIVIDVEVHGTTMELGGKPALTGILMDVTESRRAQRRIEDSEAKLKAIFDAATDGIAVADPRTHRVDSANNAFCELFGYRPEEIVGLPVRDLHPEESAADVLAQFDLQAKGQSKGSRDVPMKRNDGEVFFVDISTAPTTVGEELRLVGVFHDVTERKHNEESLRKANRALKTLSAGNEALVHATDEAGLLAAMCHAIIEVGGYHTAWVGYARPDPGRSVELMASDGRDAAILRQIRMSWGDGPYGEGVTGTAIRVGEKQLLRGLTSDPRLAAWQDILEKSDARAALGLPLSMNGSPPFGALGIMAKDEDAFDAEECSLLEELARDLAFGIIALRTRRERAAAAEQLREGLEDSIQAIATTVEMRDPYTGGHERRVAQLAEAIAAEMGLDKDRIHGLHLAGIVHDLGKIGVPAEILSKPGRLSEIELALVKTHPQNGYDILKNVDFPWPIAQMVLQHHERLDGTGYPQGLKGDQILLESRILTVADVVEAMSSHRPYRAGMGIEIALQEIEDKRLRWFDPDAVDACVRLFREKRFAFDA